MKYHSHFLRKLLLVLKILVNIAIKFITILINDVIAIIRELIYRVIEIF